MCSSQYSADPVRLGPVLDVITSVYDAVRVHLFEGINNETERCTG